MVVTEAKAQLFHFESNTATTITNAEIADTRPRIHAEMRVLGVVDYLIRSGGFGEIVSGYSPEHHYGNTVGLNDDPSEGIWIYVDKPCCAKCETVLRAYDEAQDTPRIARTGFHPSYDFDWRLPRPLRWLELTISYSALKKATST